MDKLKELFKKLSRSPKEDAVALYGDFSMRVYDKIDGEDKLIRRFAKRNQITNQGREALLQLMVPVGSATYDQEENRIWSLAVGTNSTPPSINDTEASMTIVWHDTFTFPAECDIVALPPNDFYVAISKELPASEADGYTLTEAGVFTRGDNATPSVATGKKLYARQKFSPIIKTLTMSIRFDWQLGITIQS